MRRDLNRERVLTGQCPPDNLETFCARLLNAQESGFSLSDYSVLRGDFDRVDPLSEFLFISLRGGINRLVIIIHGGELLHSPRCLLDYGREGHRLESAVIHKWQDWLAKCHRI